ncbi:MAG: hypothetical protein GY926_20550 [bacterium]|nr:hypothetical protein [bacterium]
MDVEGSLAEILELGAEWIADCGEVFAVARYSRAAGARDYELFDDATALRAWASALLPDTNLLLLKEYELSLRGPANTVRARIPDEAEVEWLIIIARPNWGSRSTSFECWGTSEVLEHLADYDDKEYVSAGRMPGWNPAVAEHAPDTLSAVVPRSDGSTHRGVY